MKKEALPLTPTVTCVTLPTEMYRRLCKPVMQLLNTLANVAADRGAMLMESFIVSTLPELNAELYKCNHCVVVSLVVLAGVIGSCFKAGLRVQIAGVQ